MTDEERERYRREIARFNRMQASVEKVVRQAFAEMSRSAKLPPAPWKPRAYYADISKGGR